MPLSVSTRGRYGLRLMVELAMGYGRGITLLKDVSRKEGLSEKYLGQIIIPLRSAGLVLSQRGSHGGYALARPPEEITVKDVVEAIEGRICPAPCAEDPAECSHAGACASSRVWRRLAEDMERSLASFTLADLAREAKHARVPAGNYSI